MVFIFLAGTISSFQCPGPHSCLFSPGLQLALGVQPFLSHLCDEVNQLLLQPGHQIPSHAYCHTEGHEFGVQHQSLQSASHLQAFDLGELLESLCFQHPTNKGIGYFLHCELL